MDKNKSLLLASLLFGLIALLHLLRAIFGWKAWVSQFEVPIYVSYLAALMLGYLAWMMYDASRQ